MAQYVLHIEPCRLCKLQRLPYFFLIFLPILMLINMRNNLIKFAIIALFVVSALLSLYHLLVIAGLIRDFCAVPAKIENLDDFMALLDADVPCSKAEWKLLGIPIPFYNFLFSSFFAFLFWRYRMDETQRDLA
jgi:disulfide bond formation protein DsbB